MADKNKPRGKPFMEVPLPSSVANIEPGTREFVPQSIRKMDKVDAWHGGGGPKFDDWYRGKPSQWEHLQNRQDPDTSGIYNRGGKVKANPFAKGGSPNSGTSYCKGGKAR